MDDAEFSAAVAALKAKEGLTVSQRLMAAVGLIVPRIKGRSGHAVARLLDLDQDYLGQAKVIFDRGTPEQIAAVLSGIATVSAVYSVLRGRSGPIGRAELMAARRAARHVRSAVWRDLRAGLLALSQLPSPPDCLAVVREFDRSGVVVDKLPPALDWLKGFAYAYEEAARRNHDGDSRNRDEPVGGQPDEPAASGAARQADRG